jgi:hypothetical protein
LGDLGAALRARPLQKGERKKEFEKSKKFKEAKEAELGTSHSSVGRAVFA